MELIDGGSLTDVIEYCVQNSNTGSLCIEEPIIALVCKAVLEVSTFRSIPCLLISDEPSVLFS